MLSILIDIFISVRIRKRALIQPNQAGHGDQNNNRQANLQKQMFILMFASICIFLITNLPLAIAKIILPQNVNIITLASQLTSIWTGLQWFQSLNFAVTIFSDLIIIQYCFI